MKGWFPPEDASFAEVRLRPCNIRSPLTPPRTPAPGCLVGLGLVPEAKPAVRIVSGPQDRRGLIDDAGLLKVVIFVFASDASYETLLRLDTVQGR